MHFLNSGHDYHKEIDLLNETNDEQTNNELMKQLINEIYRQKSTFLMKKN